MQPRTTALRRSARGLKPRDSSPPTRQLVPLEREAASRIEPFVEPTDQLRQEDAELTEK